MEGLVIREIVRDEMKSMVLRLMGEELYNAANPGRSGLFISYQAILKRDDHHVDRMWVGFLEETPIAIATIEDPYYVAGPVLNLFVKPAYRRQGIGNRFLTLISHEETGFKVFHTPASHGLYKRHGCTGGLQEYGYYHSQALAMESP